MMPRVGAAETLPEGAAVRRRLLMVCYYYPPLGGIGSMRPAKLARYLPEFGWDATVLTPENGIYFRDESLEFSTREVVRTRSLELSRVAKRVIGQPGDLKPATVGPVLRRVRDVVRQTIYFPDGQVGWYPFAVRAGSRLLRRSRFDALLSSSGPVTTHLVARRLAHRHGAPWVAEFRDTWSDPRDATEVGALSRRRARRLEASLVRDASAVVVPSPSWGELFESKGARRVQVITNGFDSADLPPRRTPRDSVLTHVGSLYPGFQDLRPVWAALHRARRLGEAPVAKLLFVGNLHPDVRSELADYGLDDMLEVTGFLSHRDALARMMSSSALLVAGGRDDRPILRGVIPGKIFEYLASGLPILYVGRTDADPARLLAQFPGCFVIGPGDVDAAEAALGAVATGPVERETDQFTWRALARRLAATLDTVASGGSRAPGN